MVCNTSGSEAVGCADFKAASSVCFAASTCPMAACIAPMRRCNSAMPVLPG